MKKTLLALIAVLVVAIAPPAVTSALMAPGTPPCDTSSCVVSCTDRDVRCSAAEDEPYVSDISMPIELYGAIIVFFLATVTVFVIIAIQKRQPDSNKKRSSRK